MEKKIKHCIIKEGKYQNTIWVIFDDDSEGALGAYYPDEINYDESDFVGLTQKQAKDFITRQDIAYLRR